MKRPVFSPEVIKVERVDACQQYLRKNNIGVADVRQVCRMGVDVFQILLSSSVVQGLANNTSDIDIIIVTCGNEASDKVATQISQGGRHYETLRFKSTDLDESLRKLRKTAEMPEEDLLKAFQIWDNESVVSRKYIERAVNGVTLEGGVPYLTHLQHLASVWQINSFNIFRECLALTTISIQAKENRAAWGYAINGMLYLMDSIMSSRGFVFNNKKWFWERWKCFGKFKYNLELYPQVSLIWADLLRSFTSFNINLVKRIYSVYDLFATELEINISEFDKKSIPLPTDLLRSTPFIDNCGLVVNRNGYSTLIELNSIEIPINKLSFSSLHMLTQREAQSLLKLIRAGFVIISI